MIKASLRRHFTQQNTETELKTWFDPLKIKSSEEDKLIYVDFPHSYFAQWFANQKKELFEKNIEQFLGPGFIIKYAFPISKANKSTEKNTTTTKNYYPYGYKYRFDNFITNKKNILAYISSRKLLLSNEAKYNPFIINGTNGTGKTHLIKAIANEINRTTENKAILLIDITELENIYKIKFQNDFNAARNYINQHDVIIIDDFHLITELNYLQNELLHTYNYFYENGKQIIISLCDYFLVIKQLSPTLKNRLESGLVVSLRKHDLDIRVKYIQEYCKESKIHISKEHILEIAQRFNNLRIINGILLSLSANKELFKKDITNSDLIQLIGNYDEKKKISLSPESIIKTISAHFQIDAKEIIGSSRRKEVVKVRQLAMYICRELLGLSYPSLGKYFGGKDHSSALYSIKKVKELLEHSTVTQNLIKELSKRCTG